MKLRLKILLKMVALLLCFGLLGAFSVLALESLRETNRETGREFGELQTIRSISVQLAASREALGPGVTARGKLSVDLARVSTNISRYIDEVAAQGAVEDADSQADLEHDVLERRHARRALSNLDQVQSAILPLKELAESDLPRLRKFLDQAALELDAVADTCSTFLHHVDSTTHSTVRTALIAMSTLSVAMLIVAAAVGMSLYRSIVVPLRELNAGVREISVGHFKKRLPERGDPEFLAVIREFNAMAGQLQEFYQRLEEKVAEKSRELVRSERLASVGYLAAGVAHEIRNPLGIISGYAELSLKMLPDSEILQKATREGRILSVIREEAFRCKLITDKLLGLARGGGEERQCINIAQTVRDVVFLVEGLDQFRERKAEFHLRVADPLSAMANPMEMKQVLLNLTLNALDSLQAGTGRIEVEGHRADGRIQLSVRDNGCGMSRDTIDHVFEPFYSTKRGRAIPGTGLGLSISHAIIRQCGGMLRAESDGVGCGSRFTIELPAM